MQRLRTFLPVLAVLPITATFASAQEPNFGRAMVMTGSELFVGQPVNWYGPGMVYVYGRTASGEWREAGRLTAPDSARMDDFGRAIAADGGTLVVGAPRKRDGTGVAYVFRRGTDGEWQHATTIEPPATGDHTGFATALVLSGDDLLVGSPAMDETGVVYHYRGTGGAWQLSGTLRPADPAGVRGFGVALSRLDDLLLVGAPDADSATGRLYFFDRSASGAWSHATTLRPPRRVAGPGARVGSAVLLDGDHAYAGAPDSDFALVLARDAGGGWSITDRLSPFDQVGGTDFGHTLAIAGDELWVGAPGINGNNGAVYRFLRDAEGGWAGALRIVPDSADGTAWPFMFGYSIASAGEAAVIGMPQRDFGEGRVLSLARSGDGWQDRQLLEGEIFRLGAGLESGMTCDEGGAIGEFPCANMELVGHLTVDELGGARGAWVNDVWGWTDPDTRRDYALVARRDGAAFVDVTDPANPRLVGSLPRTEGSPPSVWRDIKVIGNHAYIVADGARAHGMQVFDLTRLRTVADTPAVFTPDATYRGIYSAHNVVADTASKYLYVVGSNSGGETCGGGLHMVDASNPLEPTFAGCYNDRSGTNPRGYTHDAQCLVYEGPDERYRGRQICIGSNETEINIADVTDKSNPVLIARNSYPNVAYAHQGWFDEEQRYFYMNDELDELEGTVPGTRTIVWDLTQLDDPVVAGEYFAPVRASDHNLYVRGNYVFESNYGSGLRVLDISDRENPREAAFFDSAPYNENEPGHSATQSGAWSNYPFFDSGVVIFTSVREGLFIMKVKSPATIS